VFDGILYLAGASSHRLRERNPFGDWQFFLGLFLICWQWPPLAAFGELLTSTCSSLLLIPVLPYLVEHVAVVPLCPEFLRSTRPCSVALRCRIECTFASLVLCLPRPASDACRRIHVGLQSEACHAVDTPFLDPISFWWPVVQPCRVSEMPVGMLIYLFLLPSRVTFSAFLRSRPCIYTVTFQRETLDFRSRIPQCASALM